MPANWRTVRVFISSTFRDMQAERDHLVRFVFPRLRKLLLPRRLHLVGVDLRWGVTSEQDASEVCREIITECRPRFLCMLGGRYGMIPEGKELSITADEVHFGVLNTERDNLYGLFYFRHGAVAEKMDTSSPGFFREPRHSEKAAKLARLKREIRKAECKPFLYRPRWNADEERLLDLKAFGDRVEQDILATIDDEFGTQPPAQLDEFAEENAAMEAFIEERSERFVLGSREAVLNELLAHASSTAGNSYICLIGEPGSGKSALLAYLSQHATVNDQFSILLIRHFIGASPGSTDVRRMLRRLCYELKTGCPEITNEIPDDPEKLRVAFPDFLRQASAKKSVVILLDAVNQFDTSSYSGGLYWLPEDLPANSRIILSALDGPALEELRRRRNPPKEIELKLLTSDDGEAIIEQFGKRYRKQFEPEQRAALLAKTDAGTPLYLLTALEELRTLGTYKEITHRIAELPSTTQVLFTWILERLENDDGFRDTAGRKIGQELVPRFASFMGASRHGLSQRELMDLLDSGDPQGNVAALLYLLRPYLMRRGELLDFYHGQFREAAKSKYLTDDAEIDSHGQLAYYFLSKADPQRNGTWAGRNMRAFDQMPYHQYHAGMFSDLYDTLCAKPFIETVCSHLGRETMLDDLELGLAAARRQGSMGSAVSVLLTYGFVLTSQQANIHSLIDQLIRDGKVGQALRIIINELPPADGIRSLTRLAHKALDGGQVVLAEDILTRLLILKDTSPKREIREQLRLIDRLIGAGRWKSLHLLLARRPEDTAVRILLFIIGTSHFSRDLVEEMRSLLANLDDSYWRGICQLVLCLRAIRSGIAVADLIAHDLIESVNTCPQTDSGIELGIIVARSYRWIRIAGFQLSDFVDAELERQVADSAIQQPIPQCRLANNITSSTGAFGFIPRSETPDSSQQKPDWHEIVRRSLGILADGGWIQPIGGSIIEYVQRMLDIAVAESGDKWGHPLFWISLLPAENRCISRQTNINDIELHKLSHVQRLDILSSLRRMGEEDVAQSLLTTWSSIVDNKTDQTDFLQTLAVLSSWSPVSEAMRVFDDRLRHTFNSPPSAVCIALIASLLHHGLTSEAVHWLERLHSVVAPSMTLHKHHKLDPKTRRSYILLSTILPPRPSTDTPDTLLRFAHEHAVRLGENNKWLASLLGEEFGRMTPPLSYLADRILAFWVEDTASAMGDGTTALQHMTDFLQLGVINDDRERLRSWFLWLLAFSVDPNAADMARWRQGVREARAYQFRYENALLHMLDSEDDSDTPLVPQVEDELATFAALARVMRPSLIDIAPETLGKWADSALRLFYEMQDQAAALAYLAEASARSGRPEYTATYLATVSALDADIANFAEERAALGRLAVDGTLADLRQWSNPHTLQEACFSVLERLSESHQSQEELLELTQFLRHIPNLWSQIVIELCSAISNPDDAQNMFETLLHRLHDQK